MTSITFENATFQDVIGKASRVAPTRGMALDKAAGIVMEVTDKLAIIRTSNLDVMYMELLDAVEVEGNPVMWRFNATILAGFAQQLPIGSGKTVTFADGKTGDGRILVKSNRMQARLGVMTMEGYPLWAPFDPVNLHPVSNFLDRLELVSWAMADSGGPPREAICLDGEQAFATDGFKIARAPLKADLAEPIIVPDSIVRSLPKKIGDVEIGVNDNEGQLFIAPDESTQIRVALYGGDAPKIGRMFAGGEPGTIEFKGDDMVSLINRAMVFNSKAERSPNMTLLIGREEVAAHMIDRDNGDLGDFLETPGFAVHENHVRILVNPRWFLDAVSHAPSEKVKLHYDPANPLQRLRVEDGSGYEVIIVPRRSE